MKSRAPVSVPNNQIIIPPLNNNTIKIKTGTPPQKSIDSLSQFLSKMSTQNKSLKEGTYSNQQSEKSDSKNIPVNQIYGSPLSDLANQHQSSGPSLSQLANRNKAGMPLSELVNQNIAGMSLSELANQNKESMSLAEPTNRNKAGMSLAELANQNKVGMSLAELATQDQKTLGSSSNQSQSPGLSLADLAKHHQNKKSDSNLASQNRASSVSLADLANQHQKSKASSLAESGKQHISVKIGSSCLTGSIPSNPSTNQMSISGFSLADLANLHQSDMISRNENDSKDMPSSDLTNQHQNTSKLTNEHEGNSTGTKQPPLAEMAANCKSTDPSGYDRKSREIPNKSSGQSDILLVKPDIHLCKLNKSNSSIKAPNMVTGFSLAELAQQDSLYVVCGDCSKILKTNSVPEISLTSLAIKKPSKSKKDTSSAKKLKVVEKQQSETYLEETDYNDSEIFTEKSQSFLLDQTLIKSSSSLGKVLSMRYKMCPRKTSLFWKQFLYTNQVKSAILKQDVKLHVIKPFDFSTPSPDDIVKQRQKAAFT